MASKNQIYSTNIHGFVRLITTIISLQCTFLFSQQNFINVPSGEATEKYKLFFQQQINFSELVQSNTTFDFGLGRGFEIGANVLGLNFSEKHATFLNNDTNDLDPYNPLLLANALKQFNLNEKLKFTVGIQSGFNFDLDKKRSRATLMYSNLVVKNFFIKQSTLTAGAYFNTKHYGGIGNRFGGWIATEIPVYKKFHVLAESIFGSNALSYTSLGLVFYVHKSVQFTLGLQIPNTARNSYAIVFELTLIQF